MKGITLVLFALFVQPFTSTAANLFTNSAPAERVLLIDRALLHTAGAKAVLTVGPLQRSADTYAGDYRVKVSPYFFKSEKGRIAVALSAESLAKLNKGAAADLTGTATTDGEKDSRPVFATVTPTDRNQGTLKIWFLANQKKLVFNTSYHFSEGEQSADKSARILASSSE